LYRKSIYSPFTPCFLKTFTAFSAPGFASSYLFFSVIMNETGTDGNMKGNSEEITDEAR